VALLTKPADQFRTGGKRRICAEFACQLTPARFKVNRHHSGGPGQPSQLPDQKANRPGADDRNNVAELLVGPTDGVRRNRSWFCQRSV
jgi:hypothetical protein